MPIGAPPPPPSRRPTGPAGIPAPPPGWSQAGAGTGQQITDQVILKATNTPQQFPAVPVSEDVVVKGLSTNSGSVFLGLSQASQPWEIEPSGSITLDPANLDELWLKGTALDGVCYFGK